MVSLYSLLLLPCCLAKMAFHNGSELLEALEQWEKRPWGWGKWHNRPDSFPETWLVKDGNVGIAMLKKPSA